MKEVLLYLPLFFHVLLLHDIKVIHVVNTSRRATIIPLSVVHIRSHVHPCQSILSSTLYNRTRDGVCGSSKKRSQRPLRG